MTRRCNWREESIERVDREIGKSVLNRDREKWKFGGFCILEEDGITIKIIVDRISYTFTCDVKENIIGSERSDGEGFGIK